MRLAGNEEFQMPKKITRAVKKPTPVDEAGEDLPNLTFDQVVEGLLRTPAKRLRQQMAETKKAAKKKTDQRTRGGDK